MLNFKLSLLALGIFASMAAIIFAHSIIFPLPPAPLGVVGQWASEYSYPIGGTVIKVQSLAKFHRKGKYSVSGAITVEGSVDQKHYRFTYDALGEGSWTTEDQRLSINLNDLKTTPRTLNFWGYEISPLLVTKLTGLPVPTLNDAYPEGMSDDLTLLSVAPDTISLGVIDPSGNPFIIQMHRRL